MGGQKMKNRSTFRSEVVELAPYDKVSFPMYPGPTFERLFFAAKTGEVVGLPIAPNTQGVVTQIEEMAGAYRVTATIR